MKELTPQQFSIIIVSLNTIAVILLFVLVFMWRRFNKRVNTWANRTADQGERLAVIEQERAEKQKEKLLKNPFERNKVLEMRQNN